MSGTGGIHDAARRIIALVPAFNEEDRIGTTVHAVRTIPEVSQVVVVDDGSSDSTSTVAMDAGATVITLVGNRGKGGALNEGVRVLAEGTTDVAPLEDDDIVLLLDGDLAETASQAILLVEPVLTGVADMSIARFPRPRTKAGFGLVKGLARKGIASMGNGFSAEAPLSGQRAVTWGFLKRALPFASGYGVELALTVRVLRAEGRVVEVETTMSHAATGRDLAGFAHRGRQFIDVLQTLIRLRFSKD